MMKLLKVARKSLQFLHAEKGMDFEKPYVYVEGTGKFTLKSLEKLANLEGNPYDYAIGLFLKEKYNSSYDLTYVSILGFDNVNIDVSSRRWDCRIDDFTCKKCFEETRKTYSGNYYLVAQYKDYLKPILKNKVDDLSDRFKPDLSSVCYVSDRTNTSRWISKLKLTSTTSDGHVFTYTPFNYGKPTSVGSASIGIQDIIDKSGYLLVERHAELQNRVRLRKAEKAKAQVATMNFTRETLERKKFIDDIKSLLSETILSADNPKIIGKLSDVMHKYRWLVSDYQRHVRYIETDNYDSVSEVMRALSSMNETSESILNILYDIRKEN